MPLIIDNFALGAHLVTLPPGGGRTSTHRLFPPRGRVKLISPAVR